jgi:hypothetical protein
LAYFLQAPLLHLVKLVTERHSMRKGENEHMGEMPR